MRDAEGVFRIFVGKEIDEIIESGPGDARQTKRARFVGRDKHGVLRRWTSVARKPVECVKCGDFTVMERVASLGIGDRYHRG